MEHYEDYGVSERLADLIKPQCTFPKPELLEQINQALKEWDDTDTVEARLDWVGVGSLIDGQPVFNSGYTLVTRHLWIALKVAKSPFQGPFPIQPILDEPIVVIQNIFGCKCFFCLKKEIANIRRRAIRQLRKTEERIRASINNAVEVSPAPIESSPIPSPTA